MFDVNVKAVFFMIKETIPLLKKGGKASNILVTSSEGAKQSASFLGIYCMTKAAVDNMVPWLAQELMSDDIRVNAINPGMTYTKILHQQIFDKMSKKEPRALAQPHQIASLAVTICSEDGSFMNGESYVINGGFYKI